MIISAAQKDVGHFGFCEKWIHVIVIKPGEYYAKTLRMLTVKGFLISRMVSPRRGNTFMVKKWKQEVSHIF